MSLILALGIIATSAVFLICFNTFSVKIFNSFSIVVSSSSDEDSSSKDFSGLTSSGRSSSDSTWKKMVLKLKKWKK